MCSLMTSSRLSSTHYQRRTQQQCRARKKKVCRTGKGRDLPRHGGEIPETTPTLSLPQNVSMNSVVFSREVTGRCRALLDAWVSTFATKAQTNAKRDAHN